MTAQPSPQPAHAPAPHAPAPYATTPDRRPPLTPAHPYAARWKRFMREVRAARGEVIDLADIARRHRIPVRLIGAWVSRTGARTLLELENFHEHRTRLLVWSQAARAAASLADLACAADDTTGETRRKACIDLLNLAEQWSASLPPPDAPAKSSPRAPSSARSRPAAHPTRITPSAHASTDHAPAATAPTDADTPDPADLSARLRAALERLGRHDAPPT